MNAKRSGYGIRIALFSNGLFPYRVGGMQKHTTYLAKHLPGAGAQVDVYYLLDENHPPHDVVYEELFHGNGGIRVHGVKQRKPFRFPGHYYLTCLRQSHGLYRALCNSRIDYDFIYAQGYTAWYAMLAKKWLGKELPPIGMHGHGLEALQERWSFWWYVKNAGAPVWQTWNIRLADANLSLGGRLDEVIRTACGADARILPAYNGIDGAWLRPVSEIEEHGAKVRFLFVGRDSQRKGFAELNAAIGRLLEDSRFEVHLAGPIAPARRIAGDNVVYHNEIAQEDTLRNLYHACDVLVCPSYSEGMPTVILEAMASGLTVIGTDVGAVGLLVDEQVGYLIPPKNEQALVDAMRKAMSESLQQKKLAARQKVETYTWEQVTRKFVKALQESQWAEEG